jgi:N-acetylglutamate synthase-like GNAT family acetyltransferase
MPPGQITLRAVTESDQEFLLAVYAGTRAAEMAMVPWTPEQKEAFIKMQFLAQSEHYAKEYPGAKHEIICRDGSPVGRLYMERRNDAFHILDIAVLIQNRNTGIGSFILQQVMQEARDRGKPVTIYVESFNPSLALFRKLGFHTVTENGFHLLLSRLPE